MTFESKAPATGLHSEARLDLPGSREIVLRISSLWTRRAQILRPRTALLISLGVGRGWFPYYFWKKHIFSHYMKGIDLYVGRLLFVRFFIHPFEGRGPGGLSSPPHFDSTSNEHHSRPSAPPLAGISCGP